MFPFDLHYKHLSQTSSLETTAIQFYLTNFRILNSNGAQLGNENSHRFKIQEGRTGAPTLHGSRVDQ